MENIKTPSQKPYRVTWAQRVGKFYERNEQTVPGDDQVLAIVIAAIKRLPGVPAKSVRYQGGARL